MSDETTAPQALDSETGSPSVRVDPLPLQGALFATLQHLLDVVAVSDLGLPSVSDDRYASVPSLFFNVFPAQSARLSLSAARTEASAWHLRTAFRDALEATGLYLDGCRTVAAICQQARASTLTVGSFEKITRSEAGAFHGLAIPAKIERLAQEFQISTDLTDHVLSINRVRNCLVHRLGLVSDRDVDKDGNLCLLVRAMEFFAPDPAGGPDVVIDHSGMVLPENAPLMLRAKDTARLFTKGQRVELSYTEILQSFLTIMQYAMLMTGTLQTLTTVQAQAPTKSVVEA
jgi:hypothetical protein